MKTTNYVFFLLNIHTHNLDTKRLTCYFSQMNLIQKLPCFFFSFILRYGKVVKQLKLHLTDLC